MNARLHDLKQQMDREKASLRTAFKRFLKQARSSNDLLRELRHEADERNTSWALEIINVYLQTFTNEMKRSFVRVGQSEIDRARDMFVKRPVKKIAKATGSIDFSFDPNDARAASLINRSQLEFLVDFNDKQKKAIRSALSRSLREGGTYADAARAIRGSIGLTDTQQMSVNRYRDLLESGSSSALQRQLRDRRFDRTVSGAIESGDILEESQVDRMVDAYQERMLSFRADTIAATESHRVMSLARHEAWEQIADELGLEEGEFARTWNATEDNRTRDTHAAMDGQRVVGFEPFHSPSGALLNYPGDPEAPAEEVIRCRCVETYELI